MRAGGGKGEMKALDRAPWSTSKKAIKHLANGGQVCNHGHAAAWKLGLAASGRRWSRSELERGSCATRLPLCKTSERTKERGGLTSGRQIDVHNLRRSAAARPRERPEMLGRASASALLGLLAVEEASPGIALKPPHAEISIIVAIGYSY